jgi:hypothetical protein
MNPNLPSPSEQLEARLIAAARTFAYPPTPNLAAARAATPGPRRVQWRWALAFLLVMMLGALAAPQVRAALAEFIQIGVVRIFLTPPTPTPPPTSPPAVRTATPRPTATPIPSLRNLAGETTLAEAQARLGDAVRLPSYPEDLGAPNYVFVQDLGDEVVVLVWMEPDGSGKVRLALFRFGPESWGVEKVQPTVEAAATVNGQPAVWARGPYFVVLRNGDIDERRLIDGHVLIWTDGAITYRLETDLPLGEAVRVAESLR